MTNAATTFRSLLVYAFVLPLALIVGLLLGNSADPQRDLKVWGGIGLVLITMALPLILKWHRQLLFFSWNTTIVVFLLPGRPQLWLVMAFGSLLICIVQRTLVREMRFLHAPSVVYPLLYLGAIVAATQWDRGGGLASFGSTTWGARRYIMMYGAIAGFLAMIATRIQPQKALLFVGLFFLGAVTNAIGNLVNVVAPGFYWIFLIFPVEVLPGQETGQIMRFQGLSFACMGVFYYVLARYGINDVLGPNRYKRLAVLMLAVVITMLGGYRSFFLLLGVIFLIVFYLEGLFRTKKALVLIGVAILGATLMVGLSTKLPLSIQRTLSVFPIEVDPRAAYDAKGSSEWRLRMWETLLPQVGEYWLWGKGLAIEAQDFELTALTGKRNTAFDFEGALMAGDYHNGPLTAIIVFGIWGAIGWVWFLIASIRALYLNYLYGEEHLKKINTFLLAYFLARTFHYFIIFGNLYSDLAIFVGIVGLNICLNGGIRKPVRSPIFAKAAPIKFRPSLRPATSGVGR